MYELIGCIDRICELIEHIDGVCWSVYTLGDGHAFSVRSQSRGVDEEEHLDASSRVVLVADGSRGLGGGGGRGGFPSHELTEQTELGSFLRLDSFLFRILSRNFRQQFVLFPLFLQCLFFRFLTEAVCLLLLLLTFLFLPLSYLRSTSSECVR